MEPILVCDASGLSGGGSGTTVVTCSSAGHRGNDLGTTDRGAVLGVVEDVGRSSCCRQRTSATGRDILPDWSPGIRHRSR